MVARQYALLMAESPEEARKWVIALTELRNLLVRSGLPNKSPYVVREVCDTAALPLLRFVQCAAVIDREKLVLGFADHGLLCVELASDSLTPVGGEKENSKRTVDRVDYVGEEQLLLALVGASAKERHVRLIPTAALDGRDLKWIKVAEAKNCSHLCWGRGRQQMGGGAVPHYFAVAMNKLVIVYQIDRTEKRHHKMREMAMPGRWKNKKELFYGFPPLGRNSYGIYTVPKDRAYGPSKVFTLILRQP